LNFALLFFFPSEVSFVILIEIPQNVLNPKIKNTDNLEIKPYAIVKKERQDEEGKKTVQINFVLFSNIRRKKFNT
jgi:hypothetical protein